MEQYKKLIATMLICKLLLCYIGRATCLSQQRCAAEQWPKMVILVLTKYQNDNFFATVQLRVFLVKSMLLVLLLLSSAKPLSCAHTTNYFARVSLSPPPHSGQLHRASVFLPSTEA